MKSHRWMSHLIFALAASLLAFSAQAGPVFYNTGVDTNGDQLPGGSLDLHYQMRQLTPGAYIGSSDWLPAVAMNTAITWGSWIKPADARWIYIADAANLTQNWGVYEFNTTFDLTGYDPSTAILSGQWAFDQSGTVYLNGALIVTLGDGNWDGRLNPFTINSGFINGTNTLTFNVPFPDGGDGMVISGASLTATPYPALTILNSNGTTITWPTNAVGYLLQSSPTANGPYSTATNSVSLVGTNFSTTVPSSPSSEFFRLKK